MAIPTKHREIFKAIVICIVINMMDLYFNFLIAVKAFMIKPKSYYNSVRILATSSPFASVFTVSFIKKIKVFLIPHLSMVIFKLEGAWARTRSFITVFRSKKCATYSTKPVFVYMGLRHLGGILPQNRGLSI